MPTAGSQGNQVILTVRSNSCYGALVQTSVLLTELVGRLTYLAKIRKAVAALYERTTNQRDRVRSSEVAAAICGTMGREDSPAFRGDVIAALKAGGWSCVKTGCVRQWKGVRRR